MDLSWKGALTFIVECIAHDGSAALLQPFMCCIPTHFTKRCSGDQPCRQATINLTKQPTDLTQYSNEWTRWIINLERNRKGGRIGAQFLGFMKGMQVRWFYDVYDYWKEPTTVKPSNTLQSSTHTNSLLVLTPTPASYSHLTWLPPTPSIHFSAHAAAHATQVAGSKEKIANKQPGESMRCNNSKSRHFMPERVWQVRRVG
jgi:hypothetical protein